MTIRSSHRKRLEAVGFSFTAGHGDRYWTLVSPGGSWAVLLGRNGAIRATPRTARGFPISRSRAITLDYALYAGQKANEAKAQRSA